MISLRHAKRQSFIFRVFRKTKRDAMRHLIYSAIEAKKWNLKIKKKVYQVGGTGLRERGNHRSLGPRFLND